MKFNVGNWVEVTIRRLEGPDLQLIGKVIDATHDYATAECRTPEGPKRFTMSDDTFGYVFMRRMTQADWQKRR